LLFQAALAACDQLDGVKDGIISNVRDCYARFDPATAPLNGVALRCPGGVDAGPNCLSDADLATFRKIDGPVPVAFTSPTGLNRFPGFNVYTSDTGAPPTSQTQMLTTFFGFGMVQPALPPRQGMPFTFQAADQFIKYIFTEDPKFNSLSFDVDHLGRYAARWNEISDYYARDIAVGRFLRKGGKLIILQGTADMEVSPRATEALYAHYQRTIGEATVARTVRYYEAPGFAHTVSATFNAKWDPVSAIESWVEKGVDPADHLVATDASGLPGRTRPLCLYPTWPKYERGDVNAAASFVCVAQ
jgi:feruloyl esterase